MVSGGRPLRDALRFLPLRVNHHPQAHRSPQGNRAGVPQQPAGQRGNKTARQAAADEGPHEAHRVDGAFEGEHHQRRQDRQRRQGSALPRSRGGQHPRYRQTPAVLQVHARQGREERGKPELLAPVHLVKASLFSQPETTNYNLSPTQGGSFLKKKAGDTAVTSPTAAYSNRRLS
jgi:hypothetical protein